MYIITESIRIATDEDISYIYQWLVSHNGSFLCNWNLTLEMHNDKKVFVYIDEYDHLPVAYMWADFGIIEVRNDKKQMGIGRKLVEYAINCAKNSDSNIIKIECSPSTSIPFWKRMNFEFYDDMLAYKLLPKKLILPDLGKNVLVEIRFYPECKKWMSETFALQVFSPLAIQVENIIYFENRVSIFNSNHIWKSDSVVEIYINGDRVYLDKAKYQHAKQLGISEGSNSFFIDFIDMKFIQGVNSYR